MTDGSAGGERLRRAFVALWADEATSTALESLARALRAPCPQSRPLARTDLHLTLAFLGDLDCRQAGPLASALAAIECEPFVWSLDHLGTFPQPRVAWVGGAREPRLEELANTVRAVLERLRIPFDGRPWKPHITLLRHFPADVPRLAVAPSIEMAVGRPVLAWSAHGTALRQVNAVRYRRWEHGTAHAIRR